MFRSLLLSFLFGYLCRDAGALDAEAAIGFLPLMQQVSSSGLNSFLRGLIENYREVMRTGLTNLSIPVLDPLEIRRTLKLHLEDKQAFLQVNLTSVDVEGLSDFVVDSISARLNDSSIFARLRFPEIKANGTYVMDGRIIQIVPIRGNGSFSAESKNATLTATARILTHKQNTSSLRTKSYLQLNEDLDVSVNYDSMVMDIEGIEGGSSWSAVVKKILNVTSKEFLKRFVPSMKKDLNKGLVRSLNRGFKNIPVYVWSSGEKYVDALLEDIGQLIRERDETPSMPEFHASFSKEMLYTKVRGSALLRQRSLRGIENIRREGRLTVFSNETHFAVSGRLVMKYLRFVYSGHLSFMTFSETVFCKTYVPSLNFTFEITHSNQRQAQPKLSDLNLNGTPSVRTEISDLGHLKWMTPWLTEEFKKHVDKVLSRAIPMHLADYFERAISAE